MNKIGKYLATFLVLIVFIFVKTQVNFINSIRYNSNLICIIQGECPEKFKYTSEAALQLSQLNKYLPEESAQNHDLFANFTIVANVLKEYTNNVYIDRQNESILISFYIKGEYISLKAKQNLDYFELEEIQNFQYLIDFVNCIENGENP